jgi:hypothetical protein
MELALRDTLVFLKYLDSGLIPVSGFHPQNIEEFEKLLSSLSAVDRRAVNRKFRKIFRKIAKKEMANKNRPTTGWKQVYGLDSASPTKKQLRARRRLVDDTIRAQINKRLRNA